MKKAILALLLITTALFTLSGCRGGFFSGMPDGLKRVKNVQNVYDEIYNCVYDEWAGKNTVLTGASSGGWVDYDLGAFDAVRIEKNNIVLAFYNNGKGVYQLYIAIHTEKSLSSSVSYRYNPQTKTLSGKNDEQYITDDFIKYYFEWNDKSQIFSSNYSEDNLGEYTYEISEY